MEKAAADAIALFHALRQAPSADTALHAWEQLRLAEGAAIYCQGISLGTSGFGSGSSSYGHALYSGTFPC
ncbi:hypothetical protein [Streptomyces sp. NPDC001480]|uniref:hypothetical protein n=1 Tax=Streptomyces sp. NPDC001480 TaxID=3364577 RepID=UPI0036788A2B